MIRVKLLYLMPLLLLPACATIIDGTEDVVAGSSTPSAAACTVDRQGERVGEVLETPGNFKIDRSRQDLLLTCAKPGYQQAVTTVQPRFTGKTFFNFLLGGVIGFAVDAASGANNRYPSHVPVELKPLPPVLVQEQTRPLPGV
jgi:hypothetical protein